VGFVVVVVADFVDFFATVRSPVVKSQPNSRPEIVHFEQPRDLCAYKCSYNLVPFSSKKANCRLTPRPDVKAPHNLKNSPVLEALH
jgi:hypothetical protein